MIGAMIRSEAIKRAPLKSTVIGSCRPGKNIVLGYKSYDTNCGGNQVITQQSVATILKTPHGMVAF